MRLVTTSHQAPVTWLRTERLGSALRVSLGFAWRGSSRRLLARDARTCGDRSSARVTPISTGSSGRCAQTTAAKARRQPLKQRQLVEDRGEVGGGGRSLGDFLGQCHRPLAPVLRRLLQLGDPRSNPPPECGGRVFGLEVRDLSLDAALQVRDLRGRLIEAIGGGRGRLLDLGIGETPAPVLPRLSCRRERISASRSRRLRRQR
jgi:hypothetical protein